MTHLEAAPPTRRQLRLERERAALERAAGDAVRPQETLSATWSSPAAEAHRLAEVAFPSKIEPVAEVEAPAPSFAELTIRRARPVPPRRAVPAPPVPVAPAVQAVPAVSAAPAVAADPVVPEPPQAWDAQLPMTPATGESAPSRIAVLASAFEARWAEVKPFSVDWPAVLDRVRAYLQAHTRQAAGAAAATLLAGTAVIGLGGAANVNPGGPDALTPLAQTIEAVSRQNMTELTSRTLTAQLDPDSETASIAAATESNVGLILTWDTSVLERNPEAQVMLRRGIGDAPPLTPAEGVEIPLGEEPGVVRDSGLQPDTSYSYTLFIQLPGEKPEVLARLIATTSRFPTELAPGQSIALGERLASEDNSHYVAVDDTGAVVLFNNLNQKLWSLDADPDPEAVLALEADGSLVVKGPAGPVWTAEAKAPGALLVVTHDGALELLARDGSAVWSSKEAGYQLRGGDSPYVVSATGWTQPGAGPIDSPYGMRVHPIYGGVRKHNGVDMTSGKRGQPIYAAHDGVVTRVHCDSGGNWTVEIDHKEGTITRYLHMDGLGNILVQEGDEVVAGEQIARTGSSGQSTGPHLHFEVEIAGETTDPITFLKEHGVTLK